jgi:hypothetical protein
MPDLEKIRSIAESLKEQEEKLRQHHAANQHPGDEHSSIAREAVAESLKLVQSLIEVLGKAGL